MTRSYVPLSLVVALLTAARGGAQAPAALPGQAARPLELSLEVVMRLAVANSAATAVARQEFVAAKARVGQASAALLPEFGATATRSRSTMNSARFGFTVRNAAGQPILDPRGEVLGPVETLDIRATVQQRLLDPAAIVRMRAAKATATAAASEASAVASAAAANAAFLYVDAMRTAARLSAMETDSAMVAELDADAHRRHDAGLATMLDVTRADAQVASAHAALVSARTERVRAALGLRRALGLPAAVPLIFTDSLAVYASLVDALPASEADVNTIDAVLRQRDDVRSADSQVTAARRLREALRAEYLPNVSLVADRGALGITRERMLPTYTWGVQLSVPVFDGFRRARRIEEQEAQLQIRTILRRDLIERIELEVTEARLELATAKAALAAARERLTLAMRELDQTTERFNAGLSGNADVIAAQVSLSASRGQHIERLADLAAAHIAIRRAEGTLE